MFEYWWFLGAALSVIPTSLVILHAFDPKRDMRREDVGVVVRWDRRVVLAISVLDVVFSFLLWPAFLAIAALYVVIMGGSWLASTAPAAWDAFLERRALRNRKPPPPQGPHR